MKTFKLITLMLLTTYFATAQTTNYGVDSGTVGDQSSYFGKNAGASATGGSNNLFGQNAGANLSGNANVGIGYGAFRTSTSGDRNVAIGHDTGANNKGSENTILGANAGKSFEGNGNVAIGYASGFHTKGTGNLFIGNWAGSDISLADVDNQLYIQNSSDVATPLIYGDFTEGTVAIDTSYVPSGYKFAVNGKAIAEELQVMTRITWPDYVFAEDYELMPLTELEEEIETLGHLPGVPSAEEVGENGHALGEMDAILLEKIEELTLHLIEIKKEVNTLHEENTILKNEVQTLKTDKKKKKK